MPWVIDPITSGIEYKHIPGQTPGGKIRVTINRRLIDPVSGGYSETENIYAGNPPQLIEIITTSDAFSGSTRNRTQLTRAPASTIIPGAIGGFIQAEEITETYQYSGAGAIGCIGDILGSTLQQVSITTQRPVGSFADYFKYLRDRGQNPDPAPFVVVSQTIRRFEYDSKGRTSKITESTLEDPRALAGLVKGIDWVTTVVSGLAETKLRVQTWTELRLNDWQYRSKEYDAWCRSSPNSIPPGTPLLNQITPVLIKSEVSVSTSQNQPPAAERAPAQFTESSRNEKEILFFADPAAPFSPKETVYTFDLLSAGSGGLSIGGVSLWDLGKIAGQHEYGRANQIEIVSDVSDEWFTYRPYQSFRVDEPGESAIYAIAGAVFTFTQNEFKVGTRGLLVANVVGATVEYPYYQPPQQLSANLIVNTIVTGSAAVVRSIGGTVIARATVSGSAQVPQANSIGGTVTAQAIVTGTAVKKHYIFDSTPQEVSGVVTAYAIVTGSAQIKPKASIGGTVTAIATVTGSAQIKPKASIGGTVTAQGIVTGAARIKPPLIPSVLLLHFEGANNSTVFEDDSTRNINPTAFGAAKISTASPLMGTSSGEFNGTSGYLTVPTWGFTNQITTIELMIRPNVLTRQVILTSRVGGFTGAPLLQIGATGRLEFLYTGGIDGVPVVMQSINPLVVGQTYSIAVSINYVDQFNQPTNPIRLFVDGVLQATTFNTLSNGSNPLHIGGAPGDPTLGTFWLNATIDELRVTEQVLYTANYTPETSPFPNI